MADNSVLRDVKFYRLNSESSASHSVHDVVAIATNTTFVYSTGFRLDFDTPNSAENDTVRIYTFGGPAYSPDLQQGMIMVRAFSPRPVVKVKTQLKGIQFVLGISGQDEDILPALGYTEKDAE